MLESALPPVEPEAVPYVTRADAHARGLTFYFNGIPCVNGHVAERYAKNGKCFACVRMRRDYQGGPRSQEWPDEKIAELKKLHAEGVCYGLIGAKLGITRSAVAGKINRLGLASASPFARAARPNTGGGIATKIANAKRKAIPAPWTPAARILRPQPIVARNATPTANPATTIAGRFQCTIQELRDNSCRWPVTDGNPWFYCGIPSADLAAGRPYCVAHCRAAYARQAPY